MAGFRLPGPVGYDGGPSHNIEQGRMIRQVSARPGPLGCDADVASWSESRKLMTAAERMAGKLPVEMRAQFAALFTQQNAIITAGVLTAWAALHACGVGEAIDAVLMVVGISALGAQAFLGGRELGEYLLAATQAQNQSDLEIASQHLARAVISLGVATFTALIMRSGGKANLAGSEDALIGQQEAGALANLSAVQIERANLILKYLREAGVPERDFLSHLKGWNLDCPVYEMTLYEGDEVIQYIRNPARDMDGRYLPGDQTGSYFGLRGATMDGVAINSGFAGRLAFIFRVQRRVTVLEGTSARFPQDISRGIGGAGGQTQLLFRRDDLLSLTGGGAVGP